jgi:hypothetical protein
MGSLAVLWVACAVICAAIAHYKNRSGLVWLLIGFLTGIGGVIVIACIPAVPSDSQGVLTVAPFDAISPTPLPPKKVLTAAPFDAERPVRPRQPSGFRRPARSYATALEQKAWREGADPHRALEDWL